MLMLANILTILRIIAAPFVVYYIVHEDLPAALILFSLAALTDFFDGWVARKFNTTSSLGALLDPLADKILLGSAFVALALMKYIPFYLLILVLGRDALLISGYLFLKYTGRTPAINPTLSSKINTGLLALLVLLALSEDILLLELYWPQHFLMLIIVITTVWSTIQYGKIFKNTVCHHEH